ncbi:universal stress protein [Gephyromycinifex aptenodytis]|uniref:universal stress protein n=1 Tax=Gephyromycinifex aptenodytis TaxID=2716227 RepID=UPI00144623B0|nr:universal stress protein [Gephyromycinifex aptenodytis]
MKYLVAYTAHDRGRDALRLGIALAQAFGAELELVTIVRRHDPYAPAYPPVGHTEVILAKQMTEWLQEAAAEVPKEITTRTQVRFAASVAAGIEDAAQALGCGLIIVGGSSASRIRKHALGTVGTTLVHSSSVPVALAPRGYTAAGPIGHIDVAVGTREGAQQVVSEAVEVAVRRSLPVRLLTLVDTSAQADPEAAAAEREATQDTIRTLLERAVAQYGQPPSVEIDIASGSDVPAAVRSASWKDNAILLVGSSRMAEHRRIFLGSTASRMLRELQVPVVVIPRGERLSYPGHEATL